MALWLTLVIALTCFGGLASPGPVPSITVLKELIEELANITQVSAPGQGPGSKDTGWLTPGDAGPGLGHEGWAWHADACGSGRGPTAQGQVTREGEEPDQGCSNMEGRTQEGLWQSLRERLLNHS